MKRLLPLMLCLPLFVACGPILGQMMKASEGLKSFEVVDGNLSDLPEGKNLLVLGPFSITDEAFYIARGEDAANFSRGFKNSALFQTTLYIERQFDKVGDLEAKLRTSTPQQIKEMLDLKSPPDLILFGTILHRSTIVAPARGVVMDVGYRLEFIDLGTGSATIVEISVKELFEQCVPRVVSEVTRRTREGHRLRQAG